MDRATIVAVCGATILLCYCVTPVTSSNILVQGDAGGGSHYYILQRIAETLAHRGHNVTMYVSDMYGKERTPSLMNFVYYKSLVTMDEWEGLWSSITETFLSGEDFLSQLQSQLTSVHFVFKLMRDQCNSALNNDQLLKRMNEEHFDILVGDFYFKCAGLVAQALDIPYVLISCPLPAAYMLYRNPVNPSYIPATMSGFDTHMTFSTRLLNTIQTVVNLFLNLPVLADFDQLKKTYNIKPDVSAYQTLQETQLWFINTHFALDFARPLMPNTIPVGGILTGPANALDSDMESFMQDAEHGVIIFSLGGYVTIGQQKMADMFAYAFSQLPQRVIWKQRGKIPKVIPPNVKLMKWIPQNDLLGHVKTKLLVYHCGINGAFEALYHAVPIICLPVFYDQSDIAQRFASKGAGLRLDINALDSTTLVTAITRVIEDNSFRANMSKLSTIYRDDPMHPAEKVAVWTEYVIRHGGAGHLRSAAYDLNLLQYLLVDVLAFIAILLLFIMVLTIFCCKCLVGALKRKACPGKIKSE